jgi:Fic family protein
MTKSSKSRKAVYDPARPYNALPPLPPKAELETKAVLKRCVAARTELAELRVAGQLLPDQSVLINAIPMLEARASSEIENIVTTNDSLFREASLGNDGPSTDPAAKDALRYRTALHQGFQTTLRNGITGDVVYTPPEGANLIRELLGNWERYVNAESDVDPLIRMAVQHYQFEAIHPYGDGNGRTGRILNLLFLIQVGLLDKPTLYLSRHILKTRLDYYASLARVTRDGEWEAWVLYMLTAVEQTARWTNRKVDAVRKLMAHTSEFVRAVKPRLYSRELVELIFTQPYCRIENLTAHGLGTRKTVSLHLKELVEIGVLTEEKVWRDKVFIHRKYLDLLSSDEHRFAPYEAAKPSPRGRP